MEEARKHPPTDAGVLFCPSDVWRRWWNNNPQSVSWKGRDPGSRLYQWFGCPSYCYNEVGLTSIHSPLSLGLGGSGQPWGPWRDRPILESEIVAPSQMMSLADAVVGWSDGKLTEGFFGGFQRVGDIPSTGQDDFLGSVAKKNAEARARHRGALNVTFCDGHVEAIKIHTLFIDKSDDALRLWNRDNEPHRERLDPP